MTLKPLTRAVERYFSFAADRFYDRVTVGRVFRLLGGELNDLIYDQQRRAVASAAGAPILDMPVGTAYFTVAAAAEHPGIVVGSDLAEGMVAKAAETARSEGAANLALVRADAHRLPFRDRAFAAVLCNNGLPVIPGLRDTLSELVRVLDEDATLYVSAITLPVGAVLPPTMAHRMPTGFMGRTELLRAMTAAGLDVTVTATSRLATLFEARRH